MTVLRSSSSRVMVTSIFALGLLAGCGSTSGDGNQPTGASFMVVSTDWVCTQKVTTQAIPGDPQTTQTRCVTYNAHGVFKNQGAPGSAAVRFTTLDANGQPFPVCTAAIAQTATDGVSEASCQSPSPANWGGSMAPPTATIQ
jgi:hypothetical protein